MKELRPAEAVAKLTDALAEVQQALGIARTKKLLHRLANDLGAPERKTTHRE